MVSERNPKGFSYNLSRVELEDRKKITDHFGYLLFESCSRFLVKHFNKMPLFVKISFQCRRVDENKQMPGLRKAL